MMTARCSLVLALILLANEPLCAQANFFSRMFGGGRQEKADQPTGAQTATGTEAQVGTVISYQDNVLVARLANNNRMPLIGVGVGSSPHRIVGSLVSSALQESKLIRLIDTAHASKNEAMVAHGILNGVKTVESDGPVEIHVITKVWYTHLGYERTKLSVEESLADLQSAIDSDKVDLRVHLLLHWPKCYESIPWMDCQQEEDSLDNAVKAAGPDPRLDQENAWKESWRFFEDIYLSDEYPIESIGISNFHLDDIEKMDKFARIHPHVLQVNLWSLLYDSHLVDYCHKHRIHIQAYNALQGTVVEPARAPHAYHHIQKVANELSRETGSTISVAQTVLAWLVQHGVSVIPRTSKLKRLEENSGVVLSSIPSFSDAQVETVAHAVEAYMTGSDMDKDIHVSVTFHAVNQDIMLYWVSKDGSETRIDHIRKGDTFDETTYPGHVFRTYNAYNKDHFVEHQIAANFGEHTHIHVEL